MVILTQDVHGHVGMAVVDRPAMEVPVELREFEDVFSTEGAGRLPEHHHMEHAIDLTEGAQPPYGPLYNLSQAELETLRNYLADAIEKGWIRRSTSPAGALVLFVPKKGGAGLRLCVDYRGLNRITVKNRHPLPLISETLARLGTAAVFTKLDLKDAYHRIRIKKGDEWKTAFRTRYGHFEYLVMPFGLTNALATFQAYISQALSGLVDVICVIYLDDILIYSEEKERHRADVCQVLRRLREYKLYANLKKCEFLVDKVEFLGFIISTSGVSMDPSRVSAIAQWPEPLTLRELQVFLGFANFYRRFCARYAQEARLMTDLLKGSKDGRQDGPFVFTADAQEAFKKLKEVFTTAPMLVHFDPKKRGMIETDASRFGLSAIYS